MTEYNPCSALKSFQWKCEGRRIWDFFHYYWVVTSKSFRIKCYQQTVHIKPQYQQKLRKHKWKIKINYNWRNFCRVCISKRNTVYSTICKKLLKQISPEISVTNKYSFKISMSQIKFPFSFLSSLQEWTYIKT